MHVVDPDRIDRSNHYRPYTYSTPADCYTELNHSSKVIVDWFLSEIDHLNFDTEVHYWSGCVCPKEVWLSDSLLSKVHDQFPIKHAGILRLEPNRCFDWHLDGNRGVCINSIMTPDVKSICLFGNQLTIATLEVVELIYKPETFYLFNPQVPHQIITWDEARYMFSIEFDQDKHQLSYQTVKDWLDKV